MEKRARIAAGTGDEADTQLVKIPPAKEGSDWGQRKLPRCL